MSFANHNILDIALSIIPSTVVQIRKNLGTTVNKYGQAVASYGDWIDVYGIVQPGSEQNEHTQGVDFSKKRVTIWLRGVALDGTFLQWAPDQIQYVNQIYNVVSVEDWFPYDNYRKCECVAAVNLGEGQRTITRGRAADYNQSILDAAQKILEVRKRAEERAAALQVTEKTEPTPVPTPASPPQSPTSPSPPIVGRARIRI